MEGEWMTECEWRCDGGECGMLHGAQVKTRDWIEHTGPMCVDCRDQTLRLVDSETPDWLMNPICSYALQWLTVSYLTFSTFTNRGMSRGELNCSKFQCEFPWHVVCFLIRAEASVWIEYCRHTASGTTNQYVIEHFAYILCLPIDVGTWRMLVSVVGKCLLVLI